MRAALLLLAAVLLTGGAATAFLVSNNFVDGRFVFQSLPASRRPADFLVDTDPVIGVPEPLAVVQDLMDQWNAIPDGPVLFGTAREGQSYDGTNAGEAYGDFNDSRFEVAFDDDGEILAFFGVSPNVLGITLKSLITSTGELRDLLVVVNTRTSALVVPGSGATEEELFRATLLHELGHATGLGHTPVGMVNSNSFGFSPVPASAMPTMYPFRFPIRPEEGGTIEEDDRAAIRFAYRSDAPAFGSISGTVRGVSGAPVNEVAVRAVGFSATEVLHVGRLTNSDGRDIGRFTIPYVPPGRYRVILESVNGRGSVDAEVLAGDTEALGANAFVYAADEYWQPGDTWDPALDIRSSFAEVTVRAGRDTGSIDFVLGAAPLAPGSTLDGTLATGDAQVPESVGSFHFADYYAFAGTAGNEVTITASSTRIRPWLRLLRPSDLRVEAEELPVSGTSTVLRATLAQTGAYMLVLSAAASTGNPGGTGSYTVRLTGSTGTLPAPPPVSPAEVVPGPFAPAAQQFASPVCDRPMLQLEFVSPSHEEFWVDRLQVRVNGSADDAIDGTRLSLVRDLDGDGIRDSNEPVLRTVDATVDDPVLAFDDLGLVFGPGDTNHLLVLVDADVVSVQTVPQQEGSFPLPLAALVPLALLAGGRRARRTATMLLLVALVVLPSGCGGGGGSGSACNGPFDPLGESVTVQLRVEPGDVLAFTATTDPAAPLLLPASAIVSPVLEVSN